VPLARKLRPLLREGMLLLPDRAYDSRILLKKPPRPVARLSRIPARKPASMRSCPTDPDLSLAPLDGLRVRIIEARLDCTGATGTRLGAAYRLITTPASALLARPGKLVRPTMSAGKSRSPTSRAPHPARRLRVLRPVTGRREHERMGAADRHSTAHGDDRRHRDRPRHRRLTASFTVAPRSRAGAVIAARRHRRSPSAP